MPLKACTITTGNQLAQARVLAASSGNLDFMSDENSYLVSHRPRPVGTGSEPYPAEGMWVDPDIDEAASLMRHVYEHAAEAAERGARARLFIESKLSPEACGRFVAERIADINATRSASKLAKESKPATVMAKKILPAPRLLARIEEIVARRVGALLPAPGFRKP
jgi:hypothetical protein